MDKCCGTCFHWQPEERDPIGSISYKSKEPYCIQINDKGKPAVRYAETKACWLWKEREGNS